MSLMMTVVYFRLSRLLFAFYHGLSPYWRHDRSVESKPGSDIANGQLLPVVSQLYMHVAGENTLKIQVCIILFAL
jgi:hypothetical protein